MDLEIRRFSSTEILNSVSKNRIYSSSYTNPITGLETNLIKSVIEDDRDQLIVLSKHLCFTTDSSLDNNGDSRRNAFSKLLHLCCTLDSINCAALLVSGELGAAAAVNMVDSATGKSPLHVAAESHAARCVEMLLKRRARTDLKSRDGPRLLALELSLSCSRMNLVWNPDKNSIEDLVFMLSDKDLTTVKLLSEKTKEIDEVAYAIAIGGRIVALATLLIVAAEKVNESILVLHDSEIGSKAKTTIYECVIREALSMGRAATPLRAVKQTCAPMKSQSAEKRKLLLCEIELLQLFGSVACTDKKVTSPLILATQAGDETVIEILLKSNIDVNDTDYEENSALHCSLIKSSVVSTQQQNRILFLLLKRGAQVNQRNKLGLTALHIAAASGNVQAIQVLLLEDPECINAKTVTKETPLFFAVKNDHIECAELLLSWGAIAEVLNLRRERPVDFAKSQDMRFLLSTYKISHLNRSLPVQRKCTTALVEGDEVISNACQALLSMTDESTNTERICSISKTEVCKYFESCTGCIRGSKCFFAHSEEDLCKPKQGMHFQSSLAEENKRKIFVGGLPLTLDSVSLGKFFEQHFGSVEHARVSEIQKDKEIHSRGFGFVIFKHEKSVSTAVQAHYVTILGKQVEIKSCVPRNNLLAGNQKKSALPRESEHNDPSEPKAAKPGENIAEEMQSVKTTTDEAKTEKMSWADRLLNGQPKTCPNESQTRKMPKWLKTLKKWLPRFLEDVYKHPISERGYALSSLKADFRAAFGLEMDHNSLGYTKLSDFMKTFPFLCRVKAGTICNKNGSPNHMVLVLPSLPNSTNRMLQSLQIDSPSLPAESIDDSGGGDGDSNASKCSQDLLSVSNGYSGFATSSTEENPSPEALEDDSTQKNASTIVNSDEKNTSPDLHSMFVLFSLPDLFFDARMWSYNNRSNGGSGNTINERGRCLEGSKGVDLVDQERHLVLEALARKLNNSSAFFLREFNFYDNYKASMKQGRCFGCNQREMLWANIPCQHLLWCGTCKIEATKAAGSCEHKCVVCDMIVQKFDLIPPTKTYCQARIPNAEEFPPLYPSNIEIPRRRRNL
ncbi:hypothetical protein Dsin_017425 [Dipteronia sinensis]|uniref:Uncharacterized protein n=1 Tax=Dipteronia sinensis TaxID=43782 RepID=A0AAE0E6J0_9ROSI|nr:hypothetical protein Dsin_017425 [Dipteronia sinensis]